MRLFCQLCWFLGPFTRQKNSATGQSPGSSSRTLLFAYKTSKRIWQPRSGPSDASHS